MRRILVLAIAVASAFGCTSASTPTAATPPTATSPSSAGPCVYQWNYRENPVDLLYRAPLNGSSFDTPSLSRVSGQCAWQAVPVDSWITVAPSSGGDGDLFRLTVEELVQIPVVPPAPSYLRKGTIMISWPGAQTPLTVTVVQDGCSYERSQNVSVAAAGGVVGYYGANHGGCNFSPTTDVPWLSAVRNAITYVSLFAQPNTSTASRTGTLTIGWSGGESHIVVVQAGQS